MAVDLIPGLPDEVARECLIRVYYHSHPTVRRVCDLWRTEFDSAHFHRLRRFAGLSRTIIALAQAEHPAATATKYSASGASPSFRISVLDPSSGEWGALPPIPGLGHGLPLFCRISAAGRELVVVGGWDPETWVASNAVYVYSFDSGEWRRGAPMPGPRRSFFACAASGGTLLVAGGHDQDKNALRSAAAYDVGENRWEPLPDMAAERDECRGVVLDGRFHVIGGYTTEGQGRFCGSKEVLDLDTWRWGPAHEDVLETGTCPESCTVGPDGGLYRLGAGGIVAALDGTKWRVVAELPEDVRVAPQVVGFAEGLMVMGSGSQRGTQGSYVLDFKSLTWMKMEILPEYSGHIQAVCCLEL